MKGFRLLLADDNELSMKLMKVIFEAEGYTTFSAKDGAEAMTILLREKIDLIVTDILMPNVDGYYLCYKVRLHDQLNTIPIIVYSGTFTSQSEEKVAREMGANLFIRKPAPKDILISSVKELLTVPQNMNPTVTASAESFEVMHQYSSSLIDKLEHRNILLEEAKQNLERIVEERTQELKNTVEELQATNEEFEAANEELQAANEELATLNDQLSVASGVIEKQTQIILSQKDEQLNRIFDTVTDVIFVLDVEKEGEYKIASVNKAYETQRGIKASDVIGKRLEETTEKATTDKLIGKCKESIANKKIVKWELTTEMPAGKRTGEFSIAPVLDKEGNCIQLIGAVHDITERKNNEDEIKKLNGSLSDFQQAIYQSAIVSRADKQGTITYANENFVKISGYTLMELIGQNHRIINSGFHPKSFWVNMWKTISSGKIWREEVKNKAKDGSYYWVDTFIMPFVNSTGEVTQYLSIRHDITKRKRNEEELDRSQHILRKANEVGGFGNWAYYPDADKTDWDDQTLKIFGLPKDFQGSLKAYMAIVHPDDRGIVEMEVNLSLTQKKSFDLEHRIVRSDGSTIWVHERADFILDKAGNKVLIGIVQDISQRKAIDEVLREYNDRFEIVSKATNDAIWDWNILSDNLIWNHGIQTIFGYNDRQIKATGKWWKEKIHPEDFGRVSKELDEAFEKKVNNWVSQYQYKCADGGYKHVLDRAYIIYDGGKPVRIIGAMQDITEVVEFRQGLERMVEERTRKLNEALNKEKELVEMKSKFISIASHEFRTPLTTIALTTGFIKKYKTKLASDELDKKLVDIEKQVSHMTYLLDDVLMIGKAEAGKIHVNLKEINLDFFETLARQVVKSSKTGHKLVFENKCAAQSIMSDEKLMRNIVINLLTNAMKFSPGKKEVFMNISCDKKSIFIVVKDSGMGIPSWDIKNLFTTFSRGSNVGAIEGTGLGLSIVKKAVDLLNGTIEVKSQVKKGTEFTVTLPIRYV